MKPDSFQIFQGNLEVIVLIRLLVERSGLCHGNGGLYYRIVLKYLFGHVFL